MKCPNCRDVDLVSKTHYNVEFEYCGKCQGFWFDEMELHKLIHVAAEKILIPSDADKKNKPCPRCDQRMFEFKYPQTYCYVDMCKWCKGLWFDTRELEEIKVVREAKEKSGKLEEFKEPPGTKENLINFINSAISDLTSFDRDF